MYLTAAAITCTARRVPALASTCMCLGTCTHKIIVHMISGTGQRRGINSHRQEFREKNQASWKLANFPTCGRHPESGRDTLTSYLSSLKKLCRCFGPFQGCLSPLKIGVIGPDKIYSDQRIHGTCRNRSSTSTDGTPNYVVRDLSGAWTFPGVREWRTEGWKKGSQPRENDCAHA